MAFNTSTISSAVALTDTSIVVASATGYAAGNWVLIDQELMKVSQNYVSGTTIPVLRGREGTVTAAHVVTANVTTGLGSDFAIPPAGLENATAYTSVRTRTMLSYTAAGALTLPMANGDMLAIINSTVALAMTLANPTKDMDGCLMVIASNGKAAHTVTYTAGLGNIGANADVGTFPTGAQTAVQLIAVNGIWCSMNTGGTALIFPVFA